MSAPLTLGIDIGGSGIKGAPVDLSTGALTAPFAFLGPAWDDELIAAYTDGQASHLLRRRPWTLLEGPSLFSARGLRDLVDRFVTPEMIAAIADEYAQGRRLLVVTTNLDSGDSVIWDMGGLAAQPLHPAQGQPFSG